MFVDSDDAITPTALEELYPIAKKFSADIVYCEKVYPINLKGKFTTDKNFLKASITGGANYNCITEPTPTSNDIAERLRDFLMSKFYIVPWNYLIRRHLISKHEIRFPNIKYGEDVFFDLFLVCLAESIVRVPNVVYIYRIRENSIGTTNSPEIDFLRYTDHVFQGISIINKFAEKFQFLNKHPEFKYALFNFLANMKFVHIAPLYAQIPAWQLEPFVKREFEKVEDKIALTNFFFSRMNMLNLQLNQQNSLIQQMNAYIQQQNQALRQQQAKIEELQRQLENR